jgi:hypothetical protein
VGGGTLLAGIVAAVAAPGLPTGATSSCAHDAPTATAQVQMLSPRTVISSAGDRILVDGRACAPLATTRRIVVASSFPPAADTVVVDESHGRLADRRAPTARRSSP